MAKTGKADGAYDPFKPGKKAFSALEDALGALDRPTEASREAATEQEQPLNNVEQAAASGPPESVGEGMESTRDISAQERGANAPNGHDARVTRAGSRASRATRTRQAAAPSQLRVGRPLPAEGPT
mgnify:CR=1 FL=1